MNDDVLTVRAHHLVCLAHHAVHGGEHPTLPTLLDALRRDPDRRVRVVIGPDDVCIPCPHWNGTTCTRREGMEERNRVKDAAFLERVGLVDGETRTARQLHQMIAHRVTSETLRGICPTCNPDACAEAVLQSWLEG